MWCGEIMSKMTLHERLALKLFVVSALLAMQIMSLWAIDISVSALLTSPSTGQMMFLTNGFWTTNPTQLYHFGLWTVTIITVLLVAAIYLLLVELYEVKRARKEDTHSDTSET